MTDHLDSDPPNSAALLLPVVICGMLILVAIIYFGGISNGFYAQ
jgi:hypothetical protein